MKKRTLLWLVLALVVFGGGAWMAQETNLFGGITLSPRGKQLAYLKEHEEDMADFVKSLSPKVESVQFDWDSMKVGQVGNGTPQGGGYMLTLRGKVNNNDKTEFLFLLNGSVLLIFTQFSPASSLLKMPSVHSPT